MPTSEVRVPIMVTLIFMLAYIFVGSVAFTYAEEWPVGTAIYFCFVTLSTIGFGDFVPNKTFVKDTEEKNIALRRNTSQCGDMHYIAEKCITLRITTLHSGKEHHIGEKNDA